MLAIGLGLGLLLMAGVLAGVLAGLLPWPLLLLPLLHPLALLAEMVMAAALHRGDALARPPWRERWRAWAAEAGCSSRLFLREQMLREHRWPDAQAAAPGVRGVLLIHGHLCNRGVWNDWQPGLRALGVPVIAPSLEPLFVSIDQHAPVIDAAIRRLEALTGQAPLVVCHSMGGLVLRAWWRAQVQAGATPQAVSARVAGVITVGTPHRGTWLARFGLRPNVRQMRLDSDWLQALAAAETPAWRARFLCVRSDCDTIVFPPRCALLEDAPALTLPSRGHLELLDDPLLRRQVEQALRART